MNITRIRTDTNIFSVGAFIERQGLSRALLSDRRHDPQPFVLFGSTLGTRPSFDMRTRDQAAMGHGHTGKENVGKQATVRYIGLENNMR